MNVIPEQDNIPIKKTLQKSTKSKESAVFLSKL